MNRIGQASESGPLQKLMMVLLLVSVVSVLSVSYLTGISQDYDQELANGSVFEELDQADRTLNRTNEIRNTLSNVGGFTDVIVGIVTGGYNVLALFMSDIPSDFSDMINAVTGPAGLHLPDIITNFLFIGIVIVAVFAVLALVMKIRA